MLVHQMLVILLVIRQVDESLEASTLLRVQACGLPLALEFVNNTLHLSLQLTANAQTVFDDNLLQIVQPTLQLFQPACSTLKPVTCTAIEDDETVTDLLAHLVTQIFRNQISVPGLHSSVTTDIHIPTVFDSDDTQILGLSLGTLTGATGDSHFELVGHTDTLVTLLDGNSPTNRVLYSITAPSASDARLDSAQSLGVCVSRLKALRVQIVPNRRQLMQLSPKEINTLTASDLGVQAILLAYVAENLQLLGVNFTTRSTWDHGIGSIPLHVAQRIIVGVLQNSKIWSLNVVVPSLSQNRGHSRLANFTAYSSPVLLDDSCKVCVALHHDDVADFLATHLEVLTEVVCGLHTHLGLLNLEQLTELRNAATTTSSCLGALLDSFDIKASILDGTNNFALANVVAGAELGAIGKHINTPNLGRTRVRRENETLRLSGDGHFIEHHLQHSAVLVDITDKDTTHNPVHGCVGHNLLVDTLGSLADGEAFKIGLRSAQAVTNDGNITTDDLQLGGHISTCERFSFLAHDVVGNGTGHSVTRGHQTIDATTGQGALSNGVHVLSAGETELVDLDTTTRTNFDSAIAGNLVPGSDTSRKDDHICLQLSTVRKYHLFHLVVIANDLLRVLGAVDLHTHTLDVPAQHSTSSFVQLDGH
mmetsp:Transcript_146079/g.255040  ORF Transcript_146079/g.255040 Transcript_146079/m.255040 type:complete len:648 (-) Transcript_146079:564-2507(-)